MPNRSAYLKKKQISYLYNREVSFRTRVTLSRKLQMPLLKCAEYKTSLFKIYRPYEKLGKRDGKGKR